MPSVKELRQQRDDLIQKSRAILSRAETEKRSINTEEQSEIDKIVGSKHGDTEVRGLVDDLDDQIWQSEKLEAASARNAESRGRVTDPAKPAAIATPETETRSAKPINRFASDEYRAAFGNYCTRGLQSMDPTEYRALQADNDTSGGFFTMPEQMINDLIIFVNNLVFLRGLATVLPLTNADSVGVPAFDTDVSDTAWTAEIATGTEDSSAVTGKRVLRPHPLAKLIKISETLLRRSVVPVESLITERLGYKLAVVEETGFMTGSGSNQPLGLFTASAQGIPASSTYDFSCSTTTAFSADDLIGAKFALKQQYQQSPTTRWVFSRTAVKKIRQLKDGVGQYLWQQGIGGFRPDTILDTPYIMSEYAPSTFTTGLYVGLIGDLKYYWIAESLTARIQRLVELYAATNQVGFICRLESDGMPVLAEAFQRLKLA